MNGPMLAAGDIVSSTASGSSFDLRRHLGAGAFGEVWLGEEAGSGKQRALKIVPAHRAVEFGPEAEKTQRATEACGSVNVPKFYEASKGSVQGQPELFFMIVMQFIDGPTLEHAVQRPTVDLPGVRAARAVLQDVLIALKRLHQVGVIHCDVKAANILVGMDGRCVLCDFGVSQFVMDFDMGERMPKVGTPLYMAPEVVKTDEEGHCRYDTKADVWSLGVMAYELAYGITPLGEHFARIQVDNPRNAAVFDQLASGPAPTVRQDAERCPKHHAAFLRDCFVIDPELRMSVEQLLSDSFRPVSRQEREELIDWIADDE